MPARLTDPQKAGELRPGPLVCLKKPEMNLALALEIESKKAVALREFLYQVTIIVKATTKDEIRQPEISRSRRLEFFEGLE